MRTHELPARSVSFYRNNSDHPMKIYVSTKKSPMYGPDEVILTGDVGRAPVECSIDWHERPPLSPAILDAVALLHMAGYVHKGPYTHVDEIAMGYPSGNVYINAEWLKKRRAEYEHGDNASDARCTTSAEFLHGLVSI